MFQVVSQNEKIRGADLKLTFTLEQYPGADLKLTFTLEQYPDQYPGAAINVKEE